MYGTIDNNLLPLGTNVLELFFCFNKDTAVYSTVQYKGVGISRSPRDRCKMCEIFVNFFSGLYISVPVSTAKQHNIVKRRWGGGVHAFSFHSCSGRVWCVVSPFLIILPSSRRSSTTSSRDRSQ